MKDYLILSLSILIIVFSSCNREEKRSCESRVVEPATVSISLVNDNLYPHLIRTDNQFATGELISILYDGDFTSSGTKNKIEIGNQSFGVNEAFTMAPGEYAGIFRMEDCQKLSEEGFQCDCHQEELEAEFRLRFFDTTSIIIDSLRLIETLDCEGNGEECEELKVFIEGTGVNHSLDFTSDELHNGIRFSYSFNSAPENSNVFVSIEENSIVIRQFQLMTENTNEWSDGWYSINENTLQVKVLRN